MTIENDIRKRKSAWGEFHVNNSLHRLIGASRYKVGLELSENPVYLFDDLFLPKQNTENQLTEIDHVLLSKKGIFSIETKTIAGRVFGEASSKKWNVVAKLNGADRNSLRHINIQNPIRQNYAHICALADTLRIVKTNVTGFVVLIEADYDGWLPGDWGSEPVDGLFLTVENMINKINTMPDVYTSDEVEVFAQLLVPHYEKKDELRLIFNQQRNIGYSEPSQ